MSNILRAAAIKKGYQVGDEFLEVLKGVDFNLEPGESVGIMGPSGSGKSTLLHILGGLDQPDEGTICIEDFDLRSANDGQLARIRNQKIGFVFQFHHLLPDFSVVENIGLPLFISREVYKEVIEKAKDLATEVGLSSRLKHKPDQLSAGERQRVAVARAVITNPLLILADEPTGNLDYQNSIMILELLRSLKTEKKMSLVIVSHNNLVREYTDRQLQLKGGFLSAL